MASSGKKRAVKKTKSKAMGSRRRPSRASGPGLLRKLIPVVIVAAILAVLGSAGYFGYQAVVASNFFKVKSELIEVVGLPDNAEGRARSQEIKKLVTNLVKQETSSENVDARQHSFLLDLELIGQKVGELTYVKTVAVSRRMPDGLRVSVLQRERAAVFRIEGQDIWFDEDGERLDLVKKGDPDAPFVMRGLNSAETPAALEENKKRIELYGRLKTEWAQHDLAERVTEVDATDLRNLRVTVESEGGPSVLIIGSEDFVNRLRMGIEAKAQYETSTGPVQSVDVVNGSPVVVPRAKGK